MTRRRTTNITGRDRWIVSKALVLAIRALQAEKDPAISDITDMERILAASYGSLGEDHRYMLDLKKAYQLGFSASICTAETVRKWLAEHHNSDNVVALTFPTDLAD